MRSRRIADCGFRIAELGKGARPRASGVGPLPEAGSLKSEAFFTRTNHESRITHPAALFILHFALFTLLSFPALSFADYVGLEVIDRSDLTICTDPPLKLDVCDIYVILDNPSDRLISVAFSNVSTTDPAGFYQHTFGGDTAPRCNFIPIFPTLVCDSFVTLGDKCDDGDASATDPDFDGTGFNSSGTASGGWFNSAPLNGQGAPDANGRVMIGRFSYKQNKNTSGDVSVFTKLAGSQDITEFLLQPFDCSVPGGGLPPSGGTIWYVDDDGLQFNECTSWSDACPDLQTALGSANPLGGDQIWVAEGTYRPASTAGPRTGTFQLIDGTAVYGGFFATPGSEGDFDARDPDPASNGTVLSGDLQDNDLPRSCMTDSECFTNGRYCIDGFCIIVDDNEENSYHVVTGSGTNATAVLDGFTIKAGNADAQTGCGFCFEEPPGAACSDDLGCTSGPCIPEDSIGAGMIVVGGSPTVTNCTFSGNSARNAGGGMYNGFSSPTVTNCTFSANAATPFGGAGAMCNNFFSATKVRNCTFNCNAAKDAGGMGNLNGSTPEVTDCIFSNNKGITNGGALYSNGASPTVLNSTFSGNFARYGAGIMDTEQSASTLINCAFIGNRAELGGGGMFIGSGSFATLTNCLFVGNSGLSSIAHGGAMLNKGQSQITATNCTFVANTAAGFGGGIRFEDSNGIGTLNNCIFWSNVDDTDMSVGGPFTDESAQISVHLFSTADATFTNIMGLTQPGPFCDLCGEPPVCCNGTEANGNIGANPTFVREPDDGGDGFGDDRETPEDEGANDDFGNLRTAAGSPCNDAADNTAVPFDTEDIDNDGDTTERIPWDLDQASRFVDDENVFPDPGVPDLPNYPHVADMGAYEFQGCPVVACAPDLNRDGEVGAADLAQLLAAWGFSPGHQADFNCDAMVGAFDLASLLAAWGPCP